MRYAKKNYSLKIPAPRRKMKKGEFVKEPAANVTEQMKYKEWDDFCCDNPIRGSKIVSFGRGDVPLWMSDSSAQPREEKKLIFVVFHLYNNQNSCLKRRGKTL
jgi:hypothetical protein